MHLYLEYGKLAHNVSIANMQSVYNLMGLDFGFKAFGRYTFHITYFLVYKKHFTINNVKIHGWGLDQSAKKHLAFLWRISDTFTVATHWYERCGSNRRHSVTENKQYITTTTISSCNTRYPAMVYQCMYFSAKHHNVNSQQKLTQLKYILFFASKVYVIFTTDWSCNSSHAIKMNLLQNGCYSCHTLASAVIYWGDLLFQVCQ